MNIPYTLHGHTKLVQASPTGSLHSLNRDQPVPELAIVGSPI